jgi:hypothetical protein
MCVKEIANFINISLYEVLFMTCYDVISEIARHLFSDFSHTTGDSIVGSLYGEFCVIREFKHPNNDLSQTRCKFYSQPTLCECD